MKIGRLLLIPAFVIVCVSCSSATTKVGIGGIQSFTNHQNIASPNGYTVFAQKSLSRSVALRFDLSRLEDKQEYDAVTYRNLPPRGEIDRVRDRFRSYSTMSCIDLAVLLRMYNSGSIQMYFGAGLGAVFLGGDAYGIHTGYQPSVNSAEKLSFSLWLSLESSSHRLDPFSIALTIRQRLAQEEMFSATDSYSSFSSSLNSTELVLSVSASVSR